MIYDKRYIREIKDFSNKLDVMISRSEKRYGAVLSFDEFMNN